MNQSSFHSSEPSVEDNSRVGGYQKFQNLILEILERQPSNLVAEVDKVIWPVFSKCSPSHLRQRTFVLLSLVDGIEKHQNVEEFLRKIMEHILFSAGKFLESQDDEYHQSFAIAECTDPELISKTIPIVVLLRAKKISLVVKVLYNITDESSENVAIVTTELRQYIKYSPEHVINWIDALELHNFKENHLSDLIAAVLMKKADLKALLVPDETWAEKVVYRLDQTLDRRNHRSQLFEELLADGTFTDIDVTKRISRIAKDFRLDMSICAPNTVQKRKVSDFMFRLYENNSSSDRQHLAYQCFEAFDKMDRFSLIRCLKALEKKEEYAGVAYGEYYGLTPNEMTRIKADYLHRANWDRERIEEKKEEMMKALSNVEYIGEFVIEEAGIRIMIIDTEEKLEYAMRLLYEKKVCAFDVEAGYVCQSKNSMPQAVLIQIAFDDCVCLVDIYTLLQNGIHEERIKIFFTLFFRPHLSRVGFDLSSDIDFMKQTFPWLYDYFTSSSQTSFYCMQKFVRLLGKDADFDVVQNKFPKLDTHSLADVVEKWLKKKISKKERTSNWEKRPLSLEQMKYAALDARFTLEIFEYIADVLNESGTFPLLEKSKLTPRILDNPKHKKEEVKEESEEEIMANIAQKVTHLWTSDIQLFNPGVITLLIDSEFLPCVPYLRRMGFKIVDYRTASAGEAFGRSEIANFIVNYIQESVQNSSVEHLYVVTNKKGCDRLKMTLNSVNILVFSLNTARMSSILSSIVYETKANVNVEECALRCPGCGQMSSAVETPSDLFRIVFITYSKNKKFYHKIRRNEDEYDIAKNELQKRFDVMFDSNWVIQEFSEGRISFFLGNKNVCKIEMKNAQDTEEKKYHCSARLYEQLADGFKKDDIRFCLECCRFY